MGDSEFLEKQLKLHLLITKIISFKWENIYASSFVNCTSAYVKVLILPRVLYKIP